MDNLCHTLTGAAFGEAGLKTRTRFGSATLMIAANLPDVDVLVLAIDTPAVAFRRGWTHGPIAQMLLPVVLTMLVVAVANVSRARPGDAPVRPVWVLLLAYVGVGSHVALDLLNPYGLRLLAPFSWEWFYGDALFIIDPWLWTMLGVAVWLGRRRRGPSAARWGLVVATGYVALMVVAARGAREFVIETWQATHGHEPRALMVGPMPVTPLRRQVVIDAGERYHTGVFEWFPARLTLEDTTVQKNDMDPRVHSARGAPHVRGFLVWSRFPYWVLEPTPEGTRVTVRDMRFSGDTPARFAASVLVPDPPHRENNE